MPLTPFHYPVAYVIYRLDKRLILPGLIVGSMFPDLEIPIMILFFGNRIPDHLVLHSLLGAATIGTILSVLLTFLIYPTLVSSLFRIEKSKVERKCRLSLTLVFSAFLGNISHVLLDVTMHVHNPIFWPFRSDMPSPVVSVLGARNASLVIHTLVAILFLIIIINQRKNLGERLLTE